MGVRGEAQGEGEGEGEGEREAIGQWEGSQVEGNGE